MQRNVRMGRKEYRKDSIVWTVGKGLALGALESGVELQLWLLREKEERLTVAWDSPKAHFLGKALP